MNQPSPLPNIEFGINYEYRSFLNENLQGQLYECKIDMEMEQNSKFISYNFYLIFKVHIYTVHYEYSYIYIKFILNEMRPLEGLAVCTLVLIDAFFGYSYTSKQASSSFLLINPSVLRVLLIRVAYKQVGTDGCYCISLNVYKIISQSLTHS